MLRFKSLASGSSGNATLVQARSGGRATHLLVDCGLGIRNLTKRLGAAGLLADQIDAIFITHEHGDHVGCARAVALRERIPVYMSAGTYAAIEEPDFDGLLRLVRDGEPIELGALQFTPFAVPHDAREPLHLRCTDGATRLGVVTDLGYVTADVLQNLAGCRSLVLECNHDEDLLSSGPYPWFLKRRIGGHRGHLANGAAAMAARWLASTGLQQVVAAHLSKQNNRPELAQAAVADAMGCGASDVLVADEATGTGWLTA
ncbi:MBL fold metallo-hydrolase [Ramlibacter sp. AW1]|uniref:MBL fold metallo-hydrolase n=1 Tax=Ramlibacter aurantiacus TaxID=2801330 RepID=A0A936ZLK9_9BURK|nr:MBL fold metallo-hydrolase [Ramlibacter aurantiacus]MBL0419485.1 MBL fold metallo-hydrolase [Ramlibacter aurantiacus]